MRTSILAAVDLDLLLGANGAIPWRLPHDLRRFRALSWARPVVMGRRTHGSIGRALPGRTNIVLSRDEGYRAEGCLTARSLDEALALCEGADEAMVIGGAEVFRDAMARCDRAYLTVVRGRFGREGDADVATLPRLWKGWSRFVLTERERFEADAENPYAHDFLTVERRAQGASRIDLIEATEDTAAMVLRAREGDGVIE